ncbi:MAG: hypothetical protein ACP5IC_00385 [Minisyncoccia bacterium]
MKANKGIFIAIGLVVLALFAVIIYNPKGQNQLNQNEESQPTQTPSSYQTSPSPVTENTLPMTTNPITCGTIDMLEVTRAILQHKTFPVDSENALACVDNSLEQCRYATTNIVTTSGKKIPLAIELINEQCAIKFTDSHYKWHDYYLTCFLPQEAKSSFFAALNNPTSISLTANQQKAIKTMTFIGTIAGQAIGLAGLNIIAPQSASSSNQTPLDFKFDLIGTNSTINCRGIK